MGGVGRLNGGLVWKLYSERRVAFLFVKGWSSGCKKVAGGAGI